MHTIILIPIIISVVLLNFEFSMWFHLTEMCPKDVEGMANSVDLDQTGAV